MYTPSYLDTHTNKLTKGALAFGILWLFGDMCGNLAHFAFNNMPLLLKIDNNDAVPDDYETPRILLNNKLAGKHIATVSKMVLLSGLISSLNKAE